MKLLAHFTPLFHFYTPLPRFSDVFWGYLNGTLAWNWLNTNFLLTTALLLYNTQTDWPVSSVYASTHLYYTYCNSPIVCHMSISSIKEWYSQDWSLPENHRKLLIRLYLIGKYQMRIQNPVKYLKMELFAKNFNGFESVNYFIPKNFI